MSEVLDSIKELEHRGYSFEAADASLEILLRKKIGRYTPLFTLESFRCIMEKREDGRVMTEATIKLLVDGHRFIATAEGNGPVNALDKALRIAIGRFYPDLERIELTDYKVRVLDEKKGTGAITRVLIVSRRREDELGHGRRQREHHRGLVGGARRLDRVRAVARRVVSARPHSSAPRPADGRNRAPASGTHS